jgi:hypothetical protein
MQRDWDLIRKILIQVEALGDTRSQFHADEVEGADPETVSYHIRLLIDAGLVDGICSQGLDGPLRCFASALTWEGHEFLDKIRSAGMWNKIKATAREKGLSLSFDVIKVAATHAITALMGNA